MGKHQVEALIKALYADILKQFTHEHYDEIYVSHMTVGRLEQDKDFALAVEKSIKIK